MAIVHREEADTSVFPYAYPKNYVDLVDQNGAKDADASRLAWVSNKLLKPFADGYGYMWWVTVDGTHVPNVVLPDGSFSAHGYDLPTARIASQLSRLSRPA